MHVTDQSTLDKQNLPCKRYLQYLKCNGFTYGFPPLVPLADVLLTKEDIDECWPNMLQSMLGHKDWDFTRLLLRKGIDVNSVCSDSGKVPLHIAAVIMTDVPDDVFSGAPGNRQDFVLGEATRIASEARPVGLGRQCQGQYAGHEHHKAYRSIH